MTEISKISPSDLIGGIGGNTTDATQVTQEKSVNFFGGATNTGAAYASMQGPLLIQTGDTNNDENTMGTMRFINIRYKVYILIIAILLFIVYPTVQTAYTEYTTSTTQVQNMDLSIETTINKQNRYATDQSFILDIEKNQSDILACINLETSCDQLPEQIKNQLSVIKDYLQLGTLETEKMKIDEKKILSNINEFVLQDNPFSKTKQYNGQLHSIDIGDPKLERDHLYSFTVSLGITFNTKEDVLNCIKNIENRIFDHPAYGLDKAILYTIEDINYDVMNYEKTQDVTIHLVGYYYK